MAGGPGTRRRLIRGALTVALLALGVVGLRRLDVRALLAALTHADPWLVALAALGHLALIAFKSERWRLLLAPISRLPPLRLYVYLAVCWGASMILPQALAEALRVDVLRRRHGVPVAAAVAVVLAEKLFEAIGLAALLLPVPFVLPLPRAAAALVFALSVGGLSVGGGLALLARHGARRGWAPRWAPWERLAPALECLRSPRAFAAALAWSIAGHAFECALIVVMFAAVGVRAPVGASGLVLLGHASAILVPLTPGRAGALEAGVTAALRVVGVPLPTALAFALAYHATQLGPLLFVFFGRRLVAEGRDAAAVALSRPGETPAGAADAP